MALVVPPEATVYEPIDGLTSLSKHSKVISFVSILLNNEIFEVC